MEKEFFYEQRDDRSLRYAGRRLDPNRRISINASSAYLGSFDGQVAVLVACNLLSRMSPSIALNFADAKIHPALPWAGHSLHAVVLEQMQAADPFGSFVVRAGEPGDFWLNLGSGTEGLVAHGSGWNAWVGYGPSSLQQAGDLIGFGAALAVVIAVSQIFGHDFEVPAVEVRANAFNWRNEYVDRAPSYKENADLGSIWTIGAGSVGTAALYFLSLVTRQFDATVIDMDVVKLHNLDRSPIFIANDLKSPKVDSVKAYLSGLGVRSVRTDNRSLHESALWGDRQAGAVDVIIAAANENKVRYYIEAGYPPLQLYATTGQNWQTTLVRHDPYAQTCSLCLFPEQRQSAGTACATAPQINAEGEQVDAALPFLSFAAGLMTACEILKTGISGYPFNANRVVFYTRPQPSMVSAPLSHRPGCFCETRDLNLHRMVVSGDVRVASGL